MTIPGNGTAVVTGASSGIGAIYADRLARRGHDLLLVARRRKRLAGLAKYLREETGRSIEVIAADLNDTVDLAGIEMILRDGDDIRMLVNSAGVGAIGPLLASDVRKMCEMIALNVTALTRLTYAAAPGFAVRGGAIINIASAVGIAPEILNGVYGGTKAFVLALTLSLHKELAGKNVRIQAVLPGATATDFWETAGLPVAHLSAEMVMRADEMVDAALAGLDQGEVITVPSLPDAADWQAYEATRQKLIPNLSRRVAALRYRARVAA
jgi:short-subunit dehydrogenase